MIIANAIVVGVVNQIKKIITKDSFNREDGVLGIADTGQTWELWRGSWVIRNNQICISSDVSDSKASVETLKYDCAISVINTVQVTANRILFRGSDVNNHFQFQTESNHFRLYKVDNGSSTMLGSSSLVAPKSGDIMKVILKSNSIQCYANDTLLFNLTNDFNHLATKHGLMFNSSMGRFDDFLVEEL